MCFNNTFTVIYIKAHTHIECGFVISVTLLQYGGTFMMKSVLFVGLLEFFSRTECSL